ncbi:hypothetical protein EON67_06060, partial [archaeon]
MCASVCALRVIATAELRATFDPDTGKWDVSFRRVPRSQSAQQRRRLEEEGAGALTVADASVPDGAGVEGAAGDANAGMVEGGSVTGYEDVAPDGHSHVLNARTGWSQAGLYVARPGVCVAACPPSNTTSQHTRGDRHYAQCATRTRARTAHLAAAHHVAIHVCREQAQFELEFIRPHLEVLAESARMELSERGAHMVHGSTCCHVAHSAHNPRHAAPCTTLCVCMRVELADSGMLTTLVNPIHFEGDNEGWGAVAAAVAAANPGAGAASSAPSSPVATSNAAVLGGVGGPSQGMPPLALQPSAHLEAGVPRGGACCRTYNATHCTARDATHANVRLHVCVCVCVCVCVY